MVVRTTKPTGIHTRRLMESTKKSHAYQRGVEIKKQMPENQLKILKDQIDRAKIEYTSQFGKEKLTNIKIKDTQLNYYKEKIKVQGKLLEAFDRYYGFQGKLSEIHKETALTYGKDLIERDKINSYILQELNRIKSSKDAPLILRVIKKEMFIRYKMDF